MSDLPSSSSNPLPAKPPNESELMRILTDAPLARNFEATKCLLCYQDLEVDQGVILRDCFHIFCDPCLIQTIKVTIVFDVQVHCPQINGEQRCSTLLQEREIRSLLSGEDYERYERKCLEFAEGGNASSVHCLTKKCKGWIEVNGYVDSFVCSVCCQKNCLSCRAIHQGKSCKEYQALKFILEDDEDDDLEDEELEQYFSLVSLDRELAEQLQIATQSSNLENPFRTKPTINLEELLELSDAILVRNAVTSKCLICDEDIPANEGVTLRDCFHFFCEDCLVGTIKGALDENVEVRCPMILEDSQRCTTVVQEREIRSLLKPEDYEKYEQRCLEVAEGGFASSVHCLTPNCKGWVVLDGNNNVQSFTCEVCTSENCLSCKAIHPEKSCDEHKAEVKKSNDEQLTEATIKESLEKREAMLCPSCKRVITKNGGCDFIRCKCLFEICWPTRGPRWGPAGEGDESGGCHCTLEQRCHPECEGCHVYIK
ncbi:ubiquitin conjugating enzyme 7 interacting protein [Culex quinquefasciatus]|uniref:Ubiquitin conjugating enzyme 7 interacting protein n=1 Tax=Culex quinquefasciatus TaxID=7176 RepID=B0W024_CULQU|nr:ubiquitin conjugating enzyme 7 interacting protein [Culex quinquefasciatus]|eukprot:XP_001842058.1 ubiquitin conjugating enzyme 7 interacting protein [Culex quinquefasciatus]